MRDLSSESRSGTDIASRSEAVAREPRISEKHGWSTMNLGMGR